MSTDGYTHEPMEKYCCLHCGYEFEEQDWTGGGIVDGQNYLTFSCPECLHDSEFWWEEEEPNTP